MILNRAGSVLVERELPEPEPGPRQVALRVLACGVCRTDLHIVDGELAEAKLPLVLGHQVVGVVTALGSEVTDLAVGDRVGVSWLGDSCGTCTYCLEGRENLCGQARFTGYHMDGGFAEMALADSRYCLNLPAALDAAHASPLLCAGAIGYRALRMAADARRLGIYGFGAAAHLVTQVARHLGHEVLAFTRPRDLSTQAFARNLGAVWAGGSDEQPPTPLDAAILFAPVGALVPAALRAVARGGTVICAGIHMSDIPGFPYALMWGERSVRSVANLTRADAREFLELAGRLGLRPSVRSYALQAANTALADLRAGRIEGAAVLIHDRISTDHLP